MKKRERPGKKGNSIFSCFLNQGLHVFCLALDLTNHRASPAWMSHFPSQAPIFLSGNQTISSAFPRPRSRAHYECALGSSPWKRFRNLYVVPIPSLGATASPSFWNRSSAPLLWVSPPLTSQAPQGACVLELKAQSDHPPPPICTDWRCQCPESLNLESRQVVKWKDGSRPRR